MSDYTPQTWHDSPATDTPITAARLDVIESGIANHTHAGGGGGGDGLTTEQVQDIVGALIQDSAYIDATYDDTAASITLTLVLGSITEACLAFNVATQAELDAVSATIPTTESIQDIVGALIADSSVIDVTYNDASNTLSMTIKTGVVTPAMLSFDPATQAELDAVAATIGDIPAASTGTAGQVLLVNLAEDAYELGNVTGGVTIVPTPWLHHIDGYLPPFAQTNWNLLWTGAVYRPPVTGDPGATTAPYRASDGTQNAQLQYKILLGAGTWAFDWQGLVSSHSGIMDVLIDDVSVGTIDLYYTTLAYSSVASITGITIASTGVKDVKLKMATKNASSDNFYGYIQTAQFRRTA